MLQIGHYQVQEEIARGGMGVVYRAHDPAVGREVAIKVLRADGFTSPTRRKRFVREAEALARITHPHVVQVIDFNASASGDPFMVLEWVRGESLQTRLTRGGPLDVEAAVEIVTTLCGAIATCHAVGVLHRDLKPDNVLVTADGSIMLTDFGLARDVDPSSTRTQLTMDGDFLGSPGYWAPEQATGALDKIDERTDVYGLGATLFGLLTGRPPDEGTTFPQILVAAEQVKRAPSSLNPDVPAWLDAVTARALAVEGDHRFADPAELSEALAARVTPRSSSVSALLSLGLVSCGLVAALVVVQGAETPRSPPGGTASVSPALPESDTSAAGAPALAAYKRGVDLVEAERYAEAEQALGEAIRLDPVDHLAYALRAEVRRLLGNSQGALEDGDRAIRIRPDHFAAYVERGSARFAIGDWQGAIVDYTQALVHNPACSTAYHNRGVVRSQHGDLRGAIADYTDAIRLAPRNPDSWKNRGNDRYSLGDIEGAFDDFSQVISLSPSEAGGYVSRGAIRCDKQRDYLGAIEDFNRALALEPDDLRAHFNRAVAQLNLGKLAAAVVDLERILELDPEYPDVDALLRDVRSRMPMGGQGGR